MKIRGMLVGVALVAVAGCSATEVDIPSIEGHIRADLAKQVGVPQSTLTVDCPSSIDWRVGEEFRCLVEDEKGERIGVTVHMENDEGEYTWETS